MFKYKAFAPALFAYLGFVIVFLHPLRSIADLIEDVQILGSESTAQGLKVKLRTKNKGQTENYFFVEIQKSDPQAFEKLDLVLKKLLEGYKLSLRIASFTAYPSGSYYPSSAVVFEKASKSLKGSLKESKAK